MNIKISNFKLFDKGNMMAFGDIEIDDIKIYNVKLMRYLDFDHYFLGFPSYKGKDGKYYKNCYIQGETYETILNKMLDMYDTLKYEDLEPTDDNWYPQDEIITDQLPF